MDKLTPEDQAAFNATLNAQGNETANTRNWTKASQDSIKAWVDADAKNFKALVESCEDNPTAELLCLKVAQGDGGASAAALWDALSKRYNDQDKLTTTQEVGILNTMSIEEGETRGEWMDRLSKQIISIEGRGRAVDEEHRVERLLSGMNPNEKYKAEAATIQLTGNNDWDSVSSILNSYDKRDKDCGAKKESANNAISVPRDKSVINCHHCGEAGHKRPDCPNRTKPPRRPSNGKGNGGRGGGGGGGGGKGGGRGGGRRGSKARNVECNICGKHGHFASECLNAKEFRQFLQTKKRKSKKSHKDKNHDGDSDSSYMLQEHALSTNMNTSGVLDSGASSHTLDARALPSHVDIDSTQSSTIKTAKIGENLSTLGRADAGMLKQSLVLQPGTLNENLVSIPSLDNTGHITVLGNSEGLVYRGGTVTVTGGTLVATAPLDHKTNLYQLQNIQDMMQSDSVLLGSAPIKEDIGLWHKRLAHRGKRAIIKYRNAGRISGISHTVKLTAADKGICDACARTKSTRHRFMNKSKLKLSKLKPTTKSDTMSDMKDETTAASDSECESDEDEEESLPVSVGKILNEVKPLRRVIPKICTDIKGPISVAGTNGELYYQGFIEDDTKYNTAYFSKNKSDSLEHTNYHWNTVLKAEGSTCTTYQADGAPELISKDIIKLLSMCETRTMWSPAYTPELNAVIERNHRTIFEGGHAMLVESNKPLTFWCKAVSYSGLIFNVFPTNTKFGTMSPLEAKFGVVPDLRRFRVWGCICYVHVPKERRARGFIEKSYKAYFMGIDIKNLSFEAWIIDLGEMVTTAHLVFDELTPIPKTVTEGTLEFAEGSKNKKDFLFLIGQVYRDDEDGLLYVTTRVTVQKGVIVTFRGTYINNTISKEEPRPIHAADVVKMVLLYQMSHPPVVIVDNRPVRLEVRDVSEVPSSTVVDLPLAAEPATGQGQPMDDHSPVPTVTTQEEHKETTVSDPVYDSLSARAKRAADRDARTVVHIGSAAELSESVNLSYDGMQYTLHMEKLGPSMQECNYNTQTATAEEAAKWDEADMDELHSLVLVNKVWIGRNMPADKRAITTKWVRKVKTSGRYKSRLVGRGFNMVEGVDFNECFAPVAKIATFRIFLTIVAFKGLSTASLDVKTAYLNSPIDEDVYLQPPADLTRLLTKLITRTPEHQDRKYLRRMVADVNGGAKLKLLKAIYGTKQGGRQWFITIDAYIKEHGFVSNPYDHCLYILIIGADYVLLLVYVDDVLIGASNDELRDKYVKIFKDKWNITYNGKLQEFLNIQVTHRPNHLIHMSQERYITTFFEQYGFQEDPSVDSPMQENLRLPAEEESDVTTKQAKFVANFPYQQIIGCVLYVNVCTMPTIACTVSLLASFNKNPTFLACKAVVRLAKYVYNIRKVGLQLGGGRGVSGYWDSDWAGCVTTRHSRSGGINFMGNGPILWYSKMQTGVALSTMEAEHNASVPAIQNNIWIKNVVKYCKIPGMTYVYATLLRGDNKAAIAISKNPMHHQMSKHIHLKYMYVMDQVKKNNVYLEYTTTFSNCADTFTKPVGKNVHKRHLPICTGHGEVAPAVKRLRTVENESLPCPNCSCLLPPSKT
jgi:hypothetical protein